VSRRYSASEIHEARSEAELVLVRSTPPTVAAPAAPPAKVPVTAAEKALAEHIRALEPRNNLAASAQVCDFTKQPGREFRPRYGLAAARAIAHRELVIGRQMTTAEKDQYLRSLCDASK
jgi:hypothetical protein